MAKKKMIILPRLHNCNGDLKKQWFVFYSVRNPRTDKMERFKVSQGLNKFHSVKERTLAAQDICRNLEIKLKNGWSPFWDDSEVIYEDHLAYDKITRIYGKKRSANKTIHFYASKYIEWLVGRIDREGTLPTYQSKIRIFCMWIDAQAMSGNDVSTINNKVIVDFFRWLIEDQKRSKRTIAAYRQILQSMFQWLVQEKVFISNPVHDLPKTDLINDQSAIPIQPDDMRKLKEELPPNSPLWLAIQFQYYCALRPGRELRLLKIKNIDFGNGLVTVARAQAKKRITRTVVIPENFLHELMHVFKLHTCSKEFYVFGKEGKPGPFHLGKNNLRFQFNAIREQLGMPLEYKFYSPKHTGAVNASLAGIPDKHIQMQLGHSSLETTARYLRKMTGSQSTYLKYGFPSI